MKTKIKLYGDKVNISFQGIIKLIVTMIMKLIVTLTMMNLMNILFYS